jgi:hypothetical protein
VLPLSVGTSTRGGRPQNRGDKIHGEVGDDILPFAAEVRMGLYRDGDIEIPLRTALDAMLTLVRKSQAHAGFDTAWNLDGEHAFLADTLPPTTGLAGFR